MLPDDVKIISVDDHIIEPPDLWTSRLPANLADDAPRVERQPDGSDAWVFGGNVEPIKFLFVVAGLPHEEWANRATRFEEIRPSCYEPTARLAAMDEDGVWAQLLFPNYTRFAGHRFLETRDPRLALACLKAYNDYVFEEWVAADPRRFIPMNVLPLWDVELSKQEAIRAAERGCRAIAFSEDPHALGLPSIFSGEWDPVFDVIESTGMTLCLHIGSSGQTYTSSKGAPYEASVALVGVNAMAAAVDWIFSDKLLQFPRLKISLSEGGAGWVPYIIERLDVMWETRRFYAGFDPTTPLSELLRTRFSFCIIKDDLAIRVRDLIGVENLMVETDFPHADSIFPNTRTHLAKALADVPDHEARMIAETNARRIFEFPE